MWRWHGGDRPHDTHHDTHAEAGNCGAGHRDASLARGRIFGAAVLFRAVSRLNQRCALGALLTRNRRTGPRPFCSPALWHAYFTAARTRGSISIHADRGADRRHGRVSGGPVGASGNGRNRPVSVAAVAVSVAHSARLAAAEYLAGHLGDDHFPAARMSGLGDAGANHPRGNPRAGAFRLPGPSTGRWHLAAAFVLAAFAAESSPD